MNIQMQKHVRVWLESRGKNGTEGYHNCEKCGRNNGVDIHHIEGRVGVDANNELNLIMLCRECHVWAHANNHEETKTNLKFIVREILE